MSRIVLPLPMSVNEMWRARPFGPRGIYVNPDLEKYKASIRRKALEQGQAFFQGPVAVRTVFFFPNRRRDSDSGLKPLLDSLETVAYKNDRQVVGGTWIRRIDKANPRVEIEVYPWDEPTGQIQLLPEGL